MQAYAIIGIEIGNAVKSVISSTNKHNQIGIITVDMSSICKSPAVKSIACENTVKIKSS